jgi:hypothetical protein
VNTKSQMIKLKHFETQEVVEVSPVGVANGWMLCMGGYTYDLRYWSQVYGS